MPSAAASSFSVDTLRKTTSPNQKLKKNGFLSLAFAETTVNRQTTEERQEEQEICASRTRKTTVFQSIGRLLLFIGREGGQTEAVDELLPEPTVPYPGDDDVDILLTRRLEEDTENMDNTYPFRKMPLEIKSLFFVGSGR
ncbi:DNA replication licensing factor [Nymphaea thermarum]|nr:DNA replication licensing factor [Nymphaea thermarum]